MSGTIKSKINFLSKVKCQKPTVVFFRIISGFSGPGHSTKWYQAWPPWPFLQFPLCVTFSQRSLILRLFSRSFSQLLTMATMDILTSTVTSIQSKENVQGSYYTNSTCLYSAIAKPNMINKTKKTKHLLKLAGSDM